MSEASGPVKGADGSWSHTDADGNEWNARPPAVESTLYAGVREDAIRQSVPRLNDAINRLLTVAAGLAGGAVVFLKDDICTVWGRVAASGLFCAALMVAAAGVIPFESSGDASVEAIRTDLIRAKRWKARTLWGCYLALLAGFVAAIAGTAARSLG